MLEYFPFGLLICLPKIAFQMEKTKSSDCKPLFLLAYLPIPSPGLKSVSRSKSFTSFSSTNLLSYSSSSCKGVRQVSLKLNPVPFYKLSNSRFLPRSINCDSSHFSEVLTGQTCVCDMCGWISLGMDLNKPFGLVQTCYDPGCLAFWAVAWEVQFVFWLYLTALAVENLDTPVSLRRQ